MQCLWRKKENKERKIKQGFFGSANQTMKIVKKWHTMGLPSILKQFKLIMYDKIFYKNNDY